MIIPHYNVQRRGVGEEEEEELEPESDNGS
jgi:hypothetical protein